MNTQLFFLNNLLLNQNYFINYEKEIIWFKEDNLKLKEDNLKHTYLGIAIPNIFHYNVYKRSQDIVRGMT